MAKREMIMEEAEKIFAERGFYGSSIRDIAKACGSNVALIYYYFKDKEDLYEKILDETFRKLHGIVYKSMESTEKEDEKLRLFISSYIHFMGTRKYIPRIIAREMAEGGAHVEKILDRYFAHIFLRVSETIEEGREKSFSAEIHRELTPLSLIGMMGFFFFASPMVKKVLHIKEYSGDFLDRLTEHTTRMAFYGLYGKGSRTPDAVRAPETDKTEGEHP
jgi:TetR/AcrR family transcriptional regulator